MILEVRRFRSRSFRFSFRKNRWLGGAVALTNPLTVLAGRGFGDLAATGWFRWYGGLRLNYPFNRVGAGSER